MKPCNQCGKCCTKYADGGLSASADEIAWWEATRPDIAAYTHQGNIWVDPTSHQPLDRCPWLVHQNDRYLCRIYQQRPDDCRHYPVDVNQMIADGCEMIEVRDLRDTQRAQKTLDLMMADSRPS